MEYGHSRDRLLKERLRELYLKRTKEEVLAGDLPEKKERVIFCTPSDLQKDLYQYIIEQPDYILLRRCNGPCDCGVRDVRDIRCVNNLNFHLPFVSCFCGL